MMHTITQSSHSFQNYNEYLMSLHRYRPEPHPHYCHRSIEHHQQHEKPYHFRRLNPSKNRVNTRSLQSIEINRGSTVLTSKNLSNRRKLLSLERCDASEPATDRKEVQLSVRHIPAENPPNQKASNMALRTIESGGLQAKERQVKDCIQLMQGVLSEIQVQKSQKSGLVARGMMNYQAAEPSQCEMGSKEDSLSKFENYVRKVVNLRQDSKMIILRKAKTKSLISNNPAVKSTAILNAHRFQTIQQLKPKQIAPFEPRVKRKDKPYFAGGLDELQCSAIEQNNNQSSFISSVGKEALIRQLEQQRQKSTIDHGAKLVHRLKNHRKLKNVFPDGFF